MNSKIYVRKTMAGHYILASEFKDLTPEQLQHLIVTKDKFERLSDMVSEVRAYARKNPATAPQCVIDLADEISNH